MKLPVQFRVNCDLRECITAVKTHNLNYFALDQNIIDNVVFGIHVFFCLISEKLSININ